MKKSLEKGELMQAYLMLAGLLILIFVFILPQHKVGIFQTIGTSVNNYPSSANSVPNSNYVGSPGTNLKKTSSFTGSITLTSGNASSAIQPYEEYVTIQNYGQTPVDITGWRLTNNKDQQVYKVGNTEQNFAADMAFIPQGSRILNPSGGSVLEDVILQPNETAVVTTGSISNTYPYKITSFKENECTGYLGNLPYYSFTPYMNTSCVSPYNEPGLQNLDRDCQNYINGMSQCHTPLYKTVDSNGQVCNGCVDQNPTLSTSCVAFIQTHFSYPACLTQHENDPNFEGKTWHLFLNRPWEMWAANHETISLYDKQGNLVDYQSY